MYDSGSRLRRGLGRLHVCRLGAGPVFAPDPTCVARTLPRLEAIVRDAEAWFCSARPLTWPGPAQCWGHCPGLGESCRAMQSIWPGGPVVRRRLDPRHAGVLAIHLGLDGRAEGVLVRHGNVLANMAQMEQMLDVDDAIVCTWLPAYHDMGLVGGILQCWYSGRRNVLMSPLAFFQQPLTLAARHCEVSGHDDLRRRTLPSTCAFARSSPRIVASWT